MDQVFNCMWNKLKKISKKESNTRSQEYTSNFNHKRQNSVPFRLQRNKTKVNKRYSQDDIDLIYLNLNDKGLRVNPINKKNKSQPSHFYDESSLKRARRRMKLVQDFDKMLKDGFPVIKVGPTEDTDKDLTLFISLTPKVACGEN